MKTRGYFLALVSGACTGLTVAVGKVAASHLSAAMYVFLMSSISLLMMYSWRALTVGFRVRWMTWSVLNLVVLQVIFSAAALWMFWEGTRQIHTGIASFAARTELIFVLIASHLIFRERVGWVGLLGASLIAGGALIMTSKLSGSFGADLALPADTSAYGLTLVICSGLGFAASECFSKTLAHRIDASALVIWRSLFLAVIFGFIVVSAEGIASFAALKTEDFAVISLASLLGPILARLTFMWSLRCIELGTSYLLCQVEPVVTALFAWLMLGETLSESELFGALLILAGCLAVTSPTVRSPGKLLSKFRVMKARVVSQGK
jgi:drug/metabolite transporter (DMT)-like permease